MPVSVQPPDGNRTVLFPDPVKYAVSPAVFPLPCVGRMLPFQLVATSTKPSSADQLRVTPFADTPTHTQPHTAILRIIRQMNPPTVKSMPCISISLNNFIRDFSSGLPRPPGVAHCNTRCRENARAFVFGEN